MTIYVQNNSTDDLKLSLKGEIYLFLAGGISSVDETVIPYSQLLRFYGYNNGYPSISLISQPTQGEIGAAVPALQVYFTGLSVEAEALIKNNYGVRGDNNSQRKKYLLEQSVTPSTPIVATTKIGGQNTGNAVLTVPESTIFGIQNEDSNDLTYTINGITITVAGLSPSEEIFTPFTSVTIVASGKYNWNTN